MSRAVRLLVASATGVIAFSSCGQAPARDGSDCRAGVYADYAAAQRTWQSTLRDLIDSTRPDLEELNHLTIDLQMASIEVAEARFADRLSRAPERLNLQSDLSAFVNVGVNWTEEDELALLESSEDYRGLQQRHDVLRTQNDGHADWPALRTHVQAELASNPSFRNASNALEAELGQIQARLASCLAQGPSD